MHDRSHMTIDPRILTIPGRSTSGFTNQADSACTKRIGGGGAGGKVGVGEGSVFWLRKS